MPQLTEAQRGMVATIREFVRREVQPVAQDMEHADEYPFELVERMKELGLFGAVIPEEYGGLELDVSSYALVIEEICRGWMSLSGILNSHLIMAYMVSTHGTTEQKERFLPLMATGEKRGGICITEPNAGSDVQAIETRAVRDGDDYVVNGSKSLITNGRHGNTFALVTKTDHDADPPRRGISIFIAEKGPGFNVVRDIPKLGYKGVDTCELSFDDYRVSGGNLVGGEEGKGFYQIMSGLELGRINVAARCLGVARAALEEATRYAKQRETFGKPIGEHQSVQIMLANMATNIQAAHLMVLHAAEKKDRGERADMEAGMAKLFASEMCMQVATDAMRIHGGYGYTQDLAVERHFRDAPLMMIGEGTNEIQRLVIARHLLNNYPTATSSTSRGYKIGTTNRLEASVIPYFEIVGHDETYFEQRGASKEEIGIVLATGEITEGYAGRYIAKGVFTAGYERPKGYSPHKELQVVFAIREWGIAVVTVIVRFGTWEESR